MIKNKTTLNDIISILKNDYRTPGKILAWGVAVGQWMAILFIVWIVVGNFYFSPFRFMSSQTETTQAPVKPIKVIQSIVKFLEVSANSLNERQEKFERLMKTITSYAGRPLNKEELEQYLQSLSLNLSNCNTARGQYLRLFSETINPFEMPEIADKFNELVAHNSVFKRHGIDPQEENQRWKDLCDFCGREVHKVNAELIKALKVQ